MEKGKVILIGAGPGDPELITVKAARYLRQADTIIVDRLVHPKMLRLYASVNAKIIYAGKEGGCAESVSQKTINQLLVDNYAPGKLVVRLKGGDVAFYSNVLDELYTLKAHNIPYAIVPGITAASGASAYSGIPLTARGFSRGVRFITISRYEEQGEDFWSELAQTTDTLVLYMSAGQLGEIASKLIDSGADARKPLAVVEQATTPFQQVTTFTLENILQAEQGFTSPSLVIIGEVVNLHEEFKWLEPGANGRFFPSSGRKEDSGITVPIKF